jgi:PKHD-type hydroxylase
MLLQIQNLIEKGDVEKLLMATGNAEFEDGALTAGPLARRVKANLQMRQNTPLSQELGSLVLAALARNMLFYSAALPRRILPPVFNRYAEGMQYGNHVDNALMGQPSGLRADIAGTLFLSDPASYDGGELVVQDNYGFHSVKLQPGNLIVYPATSVHRVEPVRRGVRNAVIFWVQSAVREAERRRLLFDMDMSIQRLAAASADNPEVGNLTACYSNLLRMWADV